MSTSTTVAKLTDVEWERGQIAQQPPILYAVSKNGLLLSASKDPIKLKTSEGEFKQTLLGDNLDPEKICKHFFFFMRHKEKTGVKEKLEKAVHFLPAQQHP
jgi:hypothetical protein